MNFELLDGETVHQRLGHPPKTFKYPLVLFKVDLNEIQLLDKQLKLFSHNRFNLFSFYDRDHWCFGKNDLSAGIKAFAAEKIKGCVVQKVIALVQFRVLGHIFNPVCFFELHTNLGEYLYVEVFNTFNEVKPFLDRDASKIESGKTKVSFNKNFYVSPFIEFDSIFEFQYQRSPLLVSAITKRNGDNQLIATFSANSFALTDMNLLKLFIRRPWMSIAVVLGIHAQAFKLWINKIPYFKKSQFPHLQQGYFLWKKQS